LSIRPVVMAGLFFAHSPETPPDLPQAASYAARMDDDREAYEFSYALYLGPPSRPGGGADDCGGCGSWVD